MNFGVFGLLDSSVPHLNCAENIKIAKELTPPIECNFGQKPFEGKFDSFSLVLIIANR